MNDPKKANKVLADFDISNGVFCTVELPTQIMPLTYCTKFSREKNIESKPIYGDGDKQIDLINDKPETGILGTTARDLDFEKELGFVEDLNEGRADVQISDNVAVNIGFTTKTIINKKTKVKKVWLLNVTVSPPSDSLEQTTDSINEATTEYALEIAGVNIKAVDGTTDYINESGLTKKVRILSRMPGEPGYDAFLESVPVPKVKATEVAAKLQ